MFATDVSGEKYESVVESSHQMLSKCLKYMTGHGSPSGSDNGSGSGSGGSAHSKEILDRVGIVLRKLLLEGKVKEGKARLGLQKLLREEEEMRKQL